MKRFEITDENFNKLTTEELKRIKYRREKHPIRYYECEYCRHYHLTSQPAPLEDMQLVHLDKFKKFIQSDD